MKNPLGFSLALLATASFAMAHGDDDKKKNGNKPGTTPAPQNWSGAAGKGLSYSSDAFGLNLRTGVQFGLNFNNMDMAPDTLSFNVGRARTHLSGHIWNKNITYHLSNEWTETRSIKEAFLDWMFKPDMGVTVGQMKTRFGNEWASRYDELEFTKRGIATTAFSGSRSRGAMFHHDVNQFGWSVTAHNNDNSAASITAGEEGANTDNKLNWNFEAHWSNNANGPAMGSAQGDLAASGNQGMAAGIAYNVGNEQVGGTDVDVTSANLFARFDTGSGMSFAGEYFMREEGYIAGPDGEATGFQISGSWVAPAGGNGPRWGAGLRYAMISLDNTVPALLTGAGGGFAGAAADAELSEIELVLNMFYHEHAMKTQFGITLQNVDGTPAVGGSDRDNILFSILTTVVF